MARTNSHPLDYWRNYFKTARNPNVFDVIDHAIMVAATDFPEELNLQRGRIVERLSLAQCLGVDGESDDDDAAGVSKEPNQRDEDCDMVAEVLKIKKTLQSVSNEDVMLEYLARLESMAISVETLQATGIDKFVSGLKRHGSKRICDLAQTIVAGWKFTVDECMGKNQNDHKNESSISNMVDQEKKNHKIVRIKIKKPEDSVALKPNQSSSESSDVTSGCVNLPNNASMEQRKTKKVLNEAAYEEIERKFIGRCQEIENAKRQRTVKVLDRLPAPKQAIGKSPCPKTNKLLKLRKQSKLGRT